MTQLRKNLILPLSLAVLLVTFSVSCTKDDNSPDLGTKIAGTYVGTLTMVGTGTVPCSSQLTRSSNTKVKLVIVIGTSNIPLDGIEVSTNSTGIYSLSYIDSSGSFNGKVDGNTFTWTLSAGGVTQTFSGTK
jgi:hypothetical protein